MYVYVDKHPHQVIHVGFAGRVDVLQELQQVEGVAVHQMDSYGQVRLVLEMARDRKQSVFTLFSQVIGCIFQEFRTHVSVIPHKSLNYFVQNF